MNYWKIRPQRKGQCLVCQYSVIRLAIRHHLTGVMRGYARMSDGLNKKELAECFGNRVLNVILDNIE